MLNLHLVGGLAVDSYEFIAFNSYKEKKVVSNLSVIDQALESNSYCIKTRQSEVSRWLPMPVGGRAAGG